MDTTKTTPETDYDSLVAETAREHIRKVFNRLLAKIEAFVSSPLVRIRPRVSLFSGSLFVIATLFLPLVTKACTDYRPTGYEFLRGDGDWPSLLGLWNFEYVARGFYALTLILAAFATLLVIASFFVASLLRHQALLRPLYSVAGAAALFLLADFSCLWTGEALGSIVPGKAQVPLLLLTTLSVTLLGLRSKIVEKHPLIGIPLGMAGGFLLFVIAFELLAENRGMPNVGYLLVVLGFPLAYYLVPRLLLKRWRIVITIAMAGGALMFSAPGGFAIIWLVPAGLYFLIPLLLWLRLGMYAPVEGRENWKKVRSWLIPLYMAAPIATVIHFIVVVDDGAWGFVPLCIGVFLLAFGYMQLVKEAAAKQPVLSNAYPETANGLGIEAQ